MADTRSNLEQTRRLVDRLGEAEGLSGVAQRAEKKALQDSSIAGNTTRSFNLPREAAEGRASSGPAAGGIAAAPAGRGGYGGAGAPQAGYAQNKFRDIDSDKEVAADAVQNVGSQTLYRRGKLWIAANAQSVDPEKDQAKIKKVKRFSDEYFKLVKENSADENAVLATQQNEEQLLITLRGQTYQIE